ncbi:hypothetical protein M9H77_35444 [Catharanthus roseus]|uniref:Uncharacterized protein n=1 Tax=Catharanthus roseus TaxID=4058 RepID=A0ACB9ZQR7_CATRO|nr:hypothetical protein M9H77_35444 [Catharanthus roseus]
MGVAIRGWGVGNMFCETLTHFILWQVLFEWVWRQGKVGLGSILISLVKSPSSSNMSSGGGSTTNSSGFVEHCSSVDTVALVSIFNNECIVLFSGDYVLDGIMDWLCASWESKYKIYILLIDLYACPILEYQACVMYIEFLDKRLCPVLIHTLTVRRHSNMSVLFCISDADWKNQAPVELKPGPITRVWMKKFKASNGNEDNGMVAYMEEALKNKFEGKQLEGENWLNVGEQQPTADGGPAPTVVGRLLDQKGRKVHALPPTVGLSLPLLVGFSCDLAHAIYLRGFCYLACLLSL